MTFTRATGYWSDHKYNTLPAELDLEAGRVEAEVPAMATVCFFNLFDYLETKAAQPGAATVAFGVADGHVEPEKG